MGKVKKCKYCQVEIPKKVKVCPNCKRKLSANGCLVFCLTFIIIIALFITILGVIIETSGSDSTNTNSKTSTEEKSETLVDKYAVEEFIASYLGLEDANFSLVGNYREWEDGAGFIMVENTFKVNKKKHTYIARVGKDNTVYKLTIDDEVIFSADADALFDYMEKYPVE